MRGRLICLLVLVAWPLGAEAQSRGPIVPAADVGDRLTVTTVSGEQVRSRLVSDGTDGLVVSVDDRERVIARDQIARVTQYRNRFLFGPLVGLGAGLAVGLPLKARLENEGVDGKRFVAWTVGVGVAVGSIFDLVNGSERTLYEKPGLVSQPAFSLAHDGAAAGWTLRW